MTQRNRVSARPRGRRAFLRNIGASSLLAVAASALPRIARTSELRIGNPFTLGVASGEPSPDGFVIWTRLAPRPLEPDGAMPGRRVEVQWFVGTDERLREVVRKGSAIASPESAHAVHVEIDGLSPGREYFYRFEAAGEQSPIGRTRTLPTGVVAALRFAAAGCQRYEDGYFTAWREIARERFDFVFHYGDYIYERSIPSDRARPPVIRALPVSGESRTLSEYRQRYAAYKLDIDLQAAHASAPFVMSFDDHEVQNNWAAAHAAGIASPKSFLERRAAAFQAWYEHMPLRPAQRPRGPDILAYRRLVIGDLIALNVLDTRQFRSRQPCGGGRKPACPELLEPQRTMLGDQQEAWLYEGFRALRPRWHVLAQQVPLMQRDSNADPAVYALEMDKWSGAAAARERLFAAVETTRLRNLVVLTGDVHHHCVGELKKDFADRTSATLGVEFIGTSISSGGDGSDTSARFQALLEQDSHIKFYNNQRGYVRHTVTSERWQADMRVLDKVSVPGARISTRRSFIVENGHPGLADA